MKRIVETLLEEGIDESVIHRILDLIEEEYEVSEAHMSPENIAAVAKRSQKRYDSAKRTAENATKNRKAAEKKLEDAKKIVANDNINFQNSVNRAIEQNTEKKPGKPNIKDILNTVKNHKDIIKAKNALKQSAKNRNDARDNFNDAIDVETNLDMNKSDKYKKLLKTKELIKGHYAKKFGTNAEDSSMGASKAFLKKMAGEDK